MIRYIYELISILSETIRTATQPSPKRKGSSPLPPGQALGPCGSNRLSQRSMVRRLQESTSSIVTHGWPSASRRMRCAGAEFGVGVLAVDPEEFVVLSWRQGASRGPGSSGVWSQAAVPSRSLASKRPPCPGRLGARKGALPAPPLVDYSSHNALDGST